MPERSKQFVFAGLLMSLLTLSGCTEPPAGNIGATGIRFLAEAPGDRAFARADAIRNFEFPRDHGMHAEFATEWWYFTGNLETDSARHFGFELTFFRYALSSQAPQRASHWGSNQAWLAHFTLTDTRNERFVAAERMGRGALGIAGADTNRLDVHVRDWFARRDVQSQAIQLNAVADEVAISLELTEASPAVLHGDRGLDRKGAATGNASYYYSIPRLSARGSVRLSDTESLAVTGTAWLDREWATSSLDTGVEGWDWFGLQLEDGTNLMLYRLRGTDGSSSPFSTGTLMYRDGSSVRLEPDDVQYRVIERWTSPDTRISYPVEWMLSIPSLETELHVRPRLRHQEFNLALRYWEGAVTVSGSVSGARTAGVGYLELAGYQ
jgi:predicted secreted hydrolase